MLGCWLRINYTNLLMLLAVVISPSAIYFLGLIPLISASSSAIEVDKKGLDFSARRGCVAVSVTTEARVCLQTLLSSSPPLCHS